MNKEIDGIVKKQVAKELEKHTSKKQQDAVSAINKELEQIETKLHNSCVFSRYVIHNIY